MKKIFLALLIFPALFAGCDKDDTVQSFAVDFTTTVTPLYPGVAVEFRNLIDGINYEGNENTPYTCLWIFGDGSDQESGYNPSHTFDKGGYYTVGLRVTDGKYTYSCAKQVYITQTIP